MRKSAPTGGVNFFRAEDLQFLQALPRGEHQIGGLRNRTLPPHPIGFAQGVRCPAGSRQRSGARCGASGRALPLLKPVAGTRKHHLTKRGLSTLAAGRQLTERIILPAFAA